MKGFYISFIGIMLAISLVRFQYSVEPLTIGSFMAVIETFPLDIKEDFQDVVYEFGRVTASFEVFTNSFSSISSSTGLEAILDCVVGIFQIIWSLCLLVFALFKFLVLVVYDLTVLLVKLFGLLFGVSPDTFNETISSFVGNSGSSSDFTLPIPSAEPSTWFGKLLDKLWIWDW